MIGLTIARYRIAGRIGAGGWGEVFLARDVSLDRKVALKFLSPGSGSSQQARRRFLAEARAAAAIDHPNVCKIYDVGEGRGKLFIAMEYVAGKTLSEVLSVETLSLPRLLRIAVEITEALGAAHAKGIVHRDLKPSNIMLSSDGQVKVMDFGIAKQTATADQVGSERRTELTRAGVILGTPSYMSPEQAAGDMIDTRTDIFTLGIILYQMLTGIHPFQQGAPRLTMRAIMNRAHEPISLLWPQCPQRLQGVIDKMLAKAPAQRYQSALEVREELYALLASDRERATTAGQPWRPAPRHEIAVLPLVCSSTGSGSEHLTDAVTGEIIRQLSRCRELRVIAAGSVMPYQGTGTEPAVIGSELGVTTVVQGSVRWAGTHLRVSLELIDLSSGSCISSMTCTRELDTMAGIEDELATAIAGALSPDRKAQPLIPGSRTKAARHSPVTALSYLQGRYHLARLSYDEILAAIGCFEKMLSADPAHARAYAGLSSCFGSAGDQGLLPIAYAFPKARAAAQQALQHDDQLAEAYQSLALVSLLVDWDLAGAERELRRALTLSPSCAEARQLYSRLLVAAGRIREAINEAGDAVMLDPRSPAMLAHYGWVLVYGQRYDDAVTQLERALTLAPDLVPARRCLARVHALQHRFDDSLSVLPGCGLNRAELARIHATAGRSQSARALLTELTVTTAESESATEIAAAYLLLDELDQALVWLRRALQQREPELLYLQHAPEIARHSDQPELMRLFRQAGLCP